MVAAVRVRVIVINNVGLDIVTIMATRSRPMRTSVQSRVAAAPVAAEEVEEVVEEEVEEEVVVVLLIPQLQL